jgi:hypothetical protein
MHARTQAFRDDYARRIAPPGYHGWRHALFVAVCGGGMLAFTASLLSVADLARLWWLIPATLVVANVVEYLVHRHLMHRDTRLLHAMFERHTLRHHRYFTREDIEVATRDDLHAVLFPPVLLFFFAAVALGVAASVGLMFGRAAGLLFFALALAYYLAYEVLHLLAHWPQRGGVTRSALLRRLLRHHRLHHAPQIMNQGNYNIVFPLGDWLFGTLRRDDAGERANAARAGEHLT